MLSSKLLTVILILAISFLFWQAIKGRPQKIEIEKELNEAKNKFENLKKEKEYFKNFLDYFKSKGYLEKQARLRLNLKKEGEKVIFIYKKFIENLKDNQKENPENNKLSNFKKWIKFIFK